MATQTTYYNFNKPEGTDLVNPLVDTNPNWDALDADLHEFNERSISFCTEVISLGVHAISRSDQTAKFLKWIATGNYTAGDTFTVDGLVVAASTPSGGTLATGAYVTGSVVLACLNADNSAMTVFVSGTNVATDSERLGGELPSYYATDSDMGNAQTDITNLQNQMGNTSIVGIGDGTATGAIDALNTDVGALTNAVVVDEITLPSQSYGANGFHHPTVDVSKTDYTPVLVSPSYTGNRFVVVNGYDITGNIVTLDVANNSSAFTTAIKIKVMYIKN